MPVCVKICGITNVADAVRATELGADMIGLNFYAGSPRYVDEATARTIVHALPETVKPVALFVNESMGKIQAVANDLDVKTVQVHAYGHRPFPNVALSWIPAFSVKDELDLDLIRSFFTVCGLDDTWSDEHDAGAVATQGTDFATPAAVLVDAHVPGQYGGTGKTAPWHLLADFHPGVPLILAGGLTPDNVGEAIRIVKPWAVDVASGVESAQGKKDADKMRRFIDAVRAAQ